MVLHITPEESTEEVISYLEESTELRSEEAISYLEECSEEVFYLEECSEEVVVREGKKDGGQHRTQTPVENCWTNPGDGMVLMILFMCLFAYSN